MFARRIKYSALYANHFGRDNHKKTFVGFEKPFYLAALRKATSLSGNLLQYYKRVIHD